VAGTPDDSSYMIDVTVMADTRNPLPVPIWDGRGGMRCQPSIFKDRTRIWEEENEKFPGSVPNGVHPRAC
jgi:hypothetical protein